MYLLRILDVVVISKAKINISKSVMRPLRLKNLKNVVFGKWNFSSDFRALLMRLFLFLYTYIVSFSIGQSISLVFESCI